MEVIDTSLGGLYMQLRAALLLHGDIVSPKGEKTREICNVNFVLLNPRSRLMFHPKRSFSLPFACAETLMLFNETNEVEGLLRFNRRLLDFSDDGKTLYGAYGKRISPHLPALLHKLMSDQSTRQAILGVYDADDIEVETKNVPCTLALHFLIRNGKLDLHVSMRSNDFYWGFPYDVFQFTALQEVVANTIGIPLGSYYHHANSFHVYERHFALLNSIREMESTEVMLPYLVDDMRILCEYVRNNLDPYPQCMQCEDEDERQDIVPYILHRAMRKKSGTQCTCHISPAYAWVTKYK